MTSSDKNAKQAKSIVSVMVGYSQKDAISILTTAISLILSQPDQPGDQLDKPCMTFNSYLLRKGRSTRIEQDIEVKDFINSLDRYYSIEKLSVLIEDRFGKKRAPSKSSIARYLQKIARITAKAKESENL